MSSLDYDHDHDHGHDHGHDHHHDHEHHEEPSSASAAASGAKPMYWRSISELENTPEFRQALSREFHADNASVLGSDFSRRRFMQIMGASVVLAGVSGCWKEDKVVADPKAPPRDRLPGVPQFFATARELNGSAIGLLVKCIDGRPIKVEGNPQHPINGDGKLRGSVDVFALASTLEIYDPERSREVLKKDSIGVASKSWADFAAAIQPVFASQKDKKGAGLRVLAESTLSPSMLSMKEKLLKAYPEAGWVEYQPISDDSAREGAKLAFGSAVRTHYKFDQADIVLSLDGDPLTTHPAALRHAQDYVKKRKVADGKIAAPGGKMSRIYAVESVFSNIGAVADHRLPIRAEQVKPFLVALIAAVKNGGNASGDGFLAEEKTRKFVTALAKDLAANKGASLVFVGDRQPPEVHALAHQLNAELGSVGKTVTYSADPAPDRPSHVAALKSLVADLNGGKIDTLLILGGNPVYTAPADIDVAAAIAKAPNSIHLSLYTDETSQACAWHLPAAHFLESWGDARAWDGTISMIQPLIAPLYDGKSALEVLSMAVDEKPQGGEEIVKAAFKGDDHAWRKALHDGIVAGSAFETTTPKLQEIKADVAPRATKAELSNGDLEFVFLPDSKVFDGRYANNSWLQELPDFGTKMCWDNAALISPKTATALKIENETLVEVKVGGRTLEMAAYIMPGQAANSIGLILGYGRSAAGAVGGNAERTVGFNTYKLRGSDAPDIGGGLTINPTGKAYKFALVQDHHLIDTAGMKGREERMPDLIREGSLEKYLKEPAFATTDHHLPPLKSLWNEFKYEGHRWGLAVDLNACIGCNACMTACQSENNVPVVGKEQVQRGREMHWMRVDRYFTGDADEPQVATQPVMCQQCENAPCEQVCPVGATMHSNEGLNDMVYNRCIGTRYCANNCPYKVRRFNWLDWNKGLYEPKNESLKLVKNPDVTVRMRGIMEKCTYCVQRIQDVKIKTKNAGQPIVDGMITPACAQACPTTAITFGDLNDPDVSAVRRLHNDGRAYTMLADVNTKPRTAYLARIKNYNPELQPVSEKTEHESHSHHE